MTKVLFSSLSVGDNFFLSYNGKVVWEKTTENLGKNTVSNFASSFDLLTDYVWIKKVTAMKKPIELQNAENLFGKIQPDDFVVGITESGWVAAFLAGIKSREEAIVFSIKFTDAMNNL